MDKLRQAEFDKYKLAYSHSNYRMGNARRLSSMDALSGVDCRGSYLDVGTGRGEMLIIALDMGFRNVSGTEVISELLGTDVIYAPAHDLPYENDSFDVVTCFDVLEHILTEDTEIALEELARVAQHSLVVSAANYPSKSLGVELHVNQRPYEDWDKLIRDHCGGDVDWLPNKNGCLSENWRNDFD